MKKAVLSLDVEDWYHLDYFDRNECDTNSSLLDGLDVYVELLESLSLPSSFFVLGEVAEKKINFFKDLIKEGHDIGSHGWNHLRPMTLGIDEFQIDLKRSFAPIPAGAVCAIIMFPLAFIVSLLVPPVENPISFAPTLYIPVSVSLPNVTLGAPADPFVALNGAFNIKFPLVSNCI